MGPVLQPLFNEFARDHASLSVEEEDTMNLDEMMSMLKEARVLDDKCTAREVTTFFVLVNLDDEIFSNGALNRADSSAVLVFDEFWEITVRICQEKLEDFDAPPMMDGEAFPSGDDIPFEQSLDV